MKFYSETLDMMFDSAEALQEAEQQAAEKEAKKKKASEIKKAEAKKVEDAFKNFNAAKQVYNTNVLNLKKQLNNDLNAIRETLSEVNKKHEEAIAAETKAKDDAEAAYQAALNEFIAKHPEGYHMTLKDGDHVVTISSSSNEYKELADQLFDPKSFWDEWMRIFRF